jgi:hypothetical protein
MELVRTCGSTFPAFSKDLFEVSIQTSIPNQLNTTFSHGNMAHSSRGSSISPLPTIPAETLPDHYHHSNAHESHHAYQHSSRPISRTSTSIASANGSAQHYDPALGTDVSQQNSENAIDIPNVKKAASFYDRLITDWWWWELFSWTASAAAMASIAILLFVYNGQKIPQWKGGVTLNAYIAVLSAIARAAMVLPVSEALGQLKWLWVRAESRLIDFHHFDNASRGPWGSILLIITLKLRSSSFTRT